MVEGVVGIVVLMVVGIVDVGVFVAAPLRVLKPSFLR